MKRILAALIFFTRLPLWRLAEVEKDYFRGVVPLWPLAGWLTGGVMAATCWGSMTVGLPIPVCALLALLSRTLLTGALHEDGLADFCDGFGGGISRERTLEIMKDSHIGTYGVLGLLFYYLLLTSVLISLLQAEVSPLIFVVADPACKGLCSTIVCFLPYAREEKDAKNRTVYARTPWDEGLMSLVVSIAPAIVFAALQTNSIACAETLALTAIPAIMVFACLLLFMRHRIGGYTGDCCGAAFLLTELTFYLFLLIPRT
ncbi:MAG: adenosylcobinamide-GDP ribazoletransferase [Bacteroidaceae bacterium]|nr:adenosylcobinamide-GDP ribazoletransferase [Bacteroidaceae bacterium]